MLHPDEPRERVLRWRSTAVTQSADRHHDYPRHTMMSMLTPATTLGPADVKAAAERISGKVRPVTLSEADPGTFGTARVTLALEYMQHTGSFKARGAANLAAFHLETASMPEAGITIASGGNAGLACAWAARATKSKATVFLPGTAPAFKVAKLEDYGAEIRLVGTEYADALQASIAYAESSGALLSHAHDDPLIMAGAGTLTAEILVQIPDLDTIVVAVGGGGLFAGTAAALADSAVRIVAVEPENCRALNAALQAGAPVDAPVDSIAADSLGARRAAPTAFELATRPNVLSVLVTDQAIADTRQALWDHRRIVVELGGAAALAALASGAYRPMPQEKVAIVLCGANTDPSDLVPR
jgi:threonine dehydratase